MEHSNLKSVTFLSSCILLHAVVTLTLLLSFNSFGLETDQIALLAIKDRLEDPTGALNSWNKSLHYCEWHGIKCGRRHRDRVTVLDLASQKLKGTLSPHIGNLTFLRKIRLTENFFSGPAPQQLGHLIRLRVLSLDNNAFSGEIPTTLAHCSNLRMINLTCNFFTGTIPVELTFLTKLNVLILQINKLQGIIPTSLSNLSSLTHLSLAHNYLEGGIPYELCRIPTLESFQADTNRLTGRIPSCLYNLSHIKSFTVAGNQLDGNLPLDIGFAHLQVLDVANNKFSGAIPTSLSNASKLEIIKFDNNQFIGSMPRDLSKLHSLRKMSFASNQLGTILGDDLNFINSLINCSKLEQLIMDDNHLKGPMPKSIANLSSQLTILSVTRNQIHGRIPIEIGNLVNLQTLDASDNHLSGSLPTSLGHLIQLETLNLSRNRLHGSIPPSLGNCQNVSKLDFSYNNLNGTIPKQVMSLPSLEYLYFSHNALSGSLTSEVMYLTSLRILDISYNRLSGYIPDKDIHGGNGWKMKYLNMAGNFFEGNIPPSLSSFVGIERLDLSSNKLSGVIPSYVGIFKNLTHLNLSFNQLEGRVPTEGIFVYASEISVEGNSKLCGGVAELKLQPCPIKNKDSIKKRGKSVTLKVVIPVVVVSLCLVLLVLLMFFLRRMRKQSQQKKLTASSVLNDHQYPRISYAELLDGTNGFSADTLIGRGRYGTVYKGFLEQFDTIAAVKVLNLQERGASKTFLAECNALRNLRHRNLVKIITCCLSLDFQGNDFKALVYEFIPNGSLEEWLHQRRAHMFDLIGLNFLKRINIAIDVASALDYLHHHCEPAIIHCDLKPSNILLNDKMTAHLSDFGLAKVFSATSYNFSQSNASSTGIKGSIGYIPPEYGMGSLASIKGDVYSFGILLLELFTGKRPTDGMFQDGQNLHNFAKVALPEQVMNIVDRTMLLADSDGSINTVNKSDNQFRMKNCVVSVITLGVKCSAESPMERLNMGEVVSELYHIKEYLQGVRAHLE